MISAPATTEPVKRPIVDDFRWLLERSRAKRLRTMREFAEQEVIIPDGPHQGARFNCERQPFVALWLDNIDSGRWTETASVGPSQSGKTLLCSLIPVMYHLCEIGERVIFALPDLDMAADKWRDDIEPIIAASRYRDLLPTRGSGSKGAAKIKYVKLRNNAVLRFMSGGGDDKARAAYTSRVAVITEADGLDRSAETSHEADKIKQIKARTRAYGSMARIYKECTATIEQGHIWRSYQEGTRSKIILECPHCRHWVSPEREHFIGWQNAESEYAAKATGLFSCPECAKSWTEEERRAANKRNRLLHAGQEVAPDGRIVGEPMPTDTFSFRWSAVNNLFVTSADIAKDEWKARREPDEENADREMCQFLWAIPHQPSAIALVALEVGVLIKRQTQHLKGVIPANTVCLTAGIDLGKYQCHWVLVGWREGGGPHVCDYGIIDVASHELGTERALLIAMRVFRDDYCEPGWKMEGRDEPVSPDVVMVDSGWGGKDNTVVYEFCAESGDRYRPAKGSGKGKQYASQYHAPSAANDRNIQVGDHYHATLMKETGAILFHFDADYWKSFWHARCETPVDKPGAMTLFHAGDAFEHSTLAKHFTAEKQVEEYIPGKGIVVHWERVLRRNHFFDAAVNAAVGGHFCGARLMAAAVRPAAAGGSEIEISGGVKSPGGRPYLPTKG